MAWSDGLIHGIIPGSLGHDVLLGYTSLGLHLIGQETHAALKDGQEVKDMAKSLDVILQLRMLPSAKGQWATSQNQKLYSIMGLPFKWCFK